LLNKLEDSMKKLLTFLIAVLFSTSSIALAQINTFELLEKIKQNKIPPKKDKIPQQTVAKSFSHFSRFSTFLATQQKKTSTQSPAILNFSPQSKSDGNPFYTFASFDIYWDKNFITPRFIQPKNSPSLVGSKYYNFALSNVFFSFIEAHKNIFQIQDPKQELKETETINTLDRETVIRYSQYFKEIPIWGKEILAHFNKTGELTFINSNTVPTFDENTPNEAKISSSNAISTALSDLKRRTFFQDIPTDLLKLFSEPLQKANLFYFWDDPKQKPTLVWVVEIRPNLYEKFRYFIDAQTGEIVQFYQANPSDGPTKGSGIDLFNQNRTLNIFQSQGVYYLVDASKPMFNNNINQPDGVIVTYTNNYSDLTKTSRPAVVSSTSTNFNDPVAVSLHYHLGLVYDYYYSKFNRNSVDGKKKNIVGIIHITQNGESMANAFWNGEFIAVGDGGDIFYPLARGLDVIAHEFTHGVVQFTVDLEYKFQSGALNEGFADWGGAMVDRDDWLIGEDVVNPNYFPSGTNRDMSDPHNKTYPGDPNWLPAHMNEYQDLPLEKDNGGVHINVGIINKATYLIGNAIGKDKLEKIYYRVLDKRYLTKQANFVDFRLACERSAKELFGDNSPELLAVKNAFDAVGIGNSGGSSPDPDLPPVFGQHFILAVDQQLNLLYRLNEVLKSQSDIVKISKQPVYTESGSVIAPIENGVGVFYIDFNNNVRYIDLANLTDEEVAGESIYRSIAISGGKSPKIAATFIDYAPQIYIYDIAKDSTKVINLYTPTTSHSGEITEPLFAVNLSWTPSGKYLAYDAINVRYELNGDTTYYAEVNLLEPNSGTIIRIIPPMPRGIHIASPMFSQTNDNRIAFAVWDEFNQVAGLFIGDLFSGNVSQIAQSSLLTDQIATPVFSPNDTAILFQSFQPNLQQYVLYKIKLKKDKFTPDGNPYVYATGAGIPRWYAVGIRNDVSESNNPQPFTVQTSNRQIIISLNQSIPNLPVEIRIHDILGLPRIIKHFNSYENPFKFSIEELNSGVYFIQIVIGNQTFCSKFLYIR